MQQEEFVQLMLRAQALQLRILGALTAIVTLPLEERQAVGEQLSGLLDFNRQFVETVEHRLAMQIAEAANARGPHECPPPEKEH